MFQPPPGGPVAVEDRAVEWIELIGTWAIVFILLFEMNRNMKRGRL
jgi:hypothetical protein